MKRINSLKNLMNLVFSIVLLSFLLYIVVDLYNISNTLKELQKERISLAIKNEKDTFVTLLRLGFIDELKEEINKIITFSKDIENIEIKWKDKKFNYSNIKTANKIIIPLDKGKITVYYQNNLIDKFFDKYIFRFVLYASVFIPSMIILFLFIRKKILKLNVLAKKLESINFKKISSFEKIDGSYEIENITNAVNKLLKQVNRFYENQKNFIYSVVKYKNQLETAQKISEMFSWEYDCQENIFNIMGKTLKMFNLKSSYTLNDFLEHILPQDRKIFEEKIKRLCKNGEEFEVVHGFRNKENKLFYFKSVGKLKKNKIIGVSLNVTDEIKRQQKIEYLAYHDSLTSLPNRAYLKDEFLRLMNLAKRDNKKLAVLYLDLDNFKMINDTLGHENGDKLLITIAQRLKKVLRKSDFISRIGGDEFIILLYGIQDKKNIKDIINKLVQSLTEPIVIKQTPIYPTFSIGCAIYPDDSENMEELLKYADIAMYHAKNNGKNSCEFINEKLKKQINDYYNIINDLKEALKKDDELVLFFQPKIDIKNKKISGAEALIRWYHPQKGFLTPFHFISYAEKSNLITQIDRYVLKKSFEILKRWQENGFKDLILAINISPNEFKQNDFIDNLKMLLNKYKIDPSKLEIEITETISMQNMSYTVSVLEEIKKLGFKIAIDDFGTGYSSLNYLKKLPFDTLKIDQVFIKDLDTHTDDLIITEMIVQIAKVLKKQTVAEGVETKKILEIVKELEIDVVQGYYFSKPLNESDFENYVKNFKYSEK